MRPYILIWLGITIWLGIEYWALDGSLRWSTLALLQSKGLISRTIALNTTPGRIVSYWIGWAGFSAMVIMNVYSIRKRVSALEGVGRLSQWLNFHIFCGLIGPTLILFHCGLKARGLVAISFWSMLISASSGVIGRYFLTQISRKKQDFERLASSAAERISKALERPGLKVNDEQRQAVLRQSLEFVGAGEGEEERNALAVLRDSLLGDLRLIFSDPRVPTNWPRAARQGLLDYALSSRRSQTATVFEALMSYWHTFHFPFAIFMYIAALIHIASSMIFQNPH